MNSQSAEAHDLGNAWAAAGMMRVLAIIRRSNFSQQMRSQQYDLIQWIDEILTGVWQYQVRCTIAWLWRFGLRGWVHSRAMGPS